MPALAQWSTSLHGEHATVQGPQLDFIKRDQRRQGGKNGSEREEDSPAATTEKDVAIALAPYPFSHLPPSFERDVAAVGIGLSVHRDKFMRTPPPRPPYPGPPSQSAKL